MGKFIAAEEPELELEHFGLDQGQIPSPRRGEAKGGGLRASARLNTTWRAVVPSKLLKNKNFSIGADAHPPPWPSPPRGEEVTGIPDSSRARHGLGRVGQSTGWSGR